jgi:putative (di)nucleoside polyphosphate hydrolase
MAILVSCGVILLREPREIFVCHATGTSRWDLPKGVTDAGESPIDTAVREAWEESGLRLRASGLLDLGAFTYLSGKRLHLFALHVAHDAFDIAGCACRSFFRHHATGRPTPEADAYAWKPLAASTQWAGQGLVKVLAQIDWDRVETLPEVPRIDVDTTTAVGP